MSKGNNIGILTLPSLHSCASSPLPFEPLTRAWTSVPWHTVSRGRSWPGSSQICCHFHHHLQRSVNRNNSNWRVSNRKVQRPPTSRELHPRPRRRETYYIMFFFAKESVFIFIFMSCVIMMLSHSVLWYILCCVPLHRYNMCTIHRKIHTYLSYL